MKVDNITDLIGDTPLLRIDPEVTGFEHIELFAKLEMMNPVGASVKDRAAWEMIRDELPNLVAHDRTVIELSSGNTAKALAVLSSIHGIAFRTVTNRMKIPELKRLLLLMGAQLDELPGRAECVDPSDPDDPLARAHRELAANGTGYFHTDQYFNERNAEAHFFGTGAEIINDLGYAPDHFFACVGTAGSSTGVARALKKENDSLNVVGVIAHKSDFLPGIRNADELKEVGLFDVDNYDSIETVTTDDAIDAMTTLIRRCGVMAGPTTGAAFFAALRQLRTLDESIDTPQTAVFIACDRVESYINFIAERRPDLVNEPERQNSVRSLTTDDIASAPYLTLEDAVLWIDDNKPLIIDMRSTAAYNALHIDGAVNIIDSMFPELLTGGLPFEPDSPVLLTCPIGDQSRRYAALLKRMGHRNVFSLDGGIIGWRDMGMPLVGAVR